MKKASDRLWWLRKSVEPKINTSSEKHLATASAQQRESTQRADLQRLPDVGAKSQNMCAFKMHTVCYARLITKTEAYLTVTELIKTTFTGVRHFGSLVACAAEDNTTATVLTGKYLKAKSTPG